MLGKTFLSALLSFHFVLSTSGQQPTPTTAPARTAPSTQDQEEQDVVRITTNLVQVDVVVTKDGKQVTDLKPEDFELFEDGRPQQITNFSYISNVPTVPSKVAATPPAKD